MDIMSAIGDFFAPLPVWDARGEINMPLFSTPHQLWLIICIGICVLLVSGHHGLAPYPRSRRSFELRIVWAPIVLFCVHAASMLAFGVFNPNCLPLHLCNLAEILAVVFAITGSEFSGVTLYGIGLIGSLSALFFPGWTTAPAFSLPSICGFLEHILVVSFIIMKLRDKSISPTPAHVWQPLVFTGFYASAIYPFNKLHGTNFGFINWPLAGTPLELWERMYGNPGYVFAFAVAFASLELLLFLPWKLKGKKRGGKKPQ